MKPYFDTPERVSRLARVAESWIGTPFHPNGRVRGAGVSCQMLPPAIYVELGCLPKSVADDIPSGPMNWGHAQRKSLIEPHLDINLTEYFESILSEKLPLFLTTALMPGDLLGFQIGGCVHHIGVCLGRNFIHVLPTKQGVLYCRLDDACWLTRLRRVWRPIERVHGR